MDTNEITQLRQQIAALEKRLNEAENQRRADLAAMKEHVEHHFAMIYDDCTRICDLLVPVAHRVFPKMAHKLRPTPVIRYDHSPPIGTMRQQLDDPSPSGPWSAIGKRRPGPRQAAPNADQKGYPPFRTPLWMQRLRRLMVRT